LNRNTQAICEIDNEIIRFSASLELLLTINPEESSNSIPLAARGNFQLYIAEKTLSGEIEGVIPPESATYCLQSFSCLLFCQDAGKQGLTNRIHELILGVTRIKVHEIVVQGMFNTCFLIIHDNENTASKAVIEHIKKNGGKMIELDTGGNRHVKFRMSNGQEVQFDPNRIFTDKGTEKDLKNKNQGKGYENNDTIKNEIKKLKDKILQLLIECNCNPVVAVHDNTEDKYGIDSYLYGGGEEKKGNTRKKEGNPNKRADEDPDNFLLVTSEEYFDKLKGKYNVILQTNNNNSTRKNGPYDDGSLSVHMKDGNYINCEAKHASLDKQKDMLEDIEKMKSCQTLSK
jgi:hypothetical protein